MTVLRQRGRKKERGSNCPPDKWHTWVAYYMVAGIKSGREYSRDELDERVILDGNLRMFDQVLANSTDTNGETHRHFTLGWKEDYLPPKTLDAIYQDLKTFLLAAYDEDEAFIFAEAHHPKIKSYINTKGKRIIRYGHLHVLLAAKNAKTGSNDVNPMGYYPLREDYANAFQSYIDSKYGLASPDDNRRVVVTDESTVIEDHNGNPFYGDSNKVVKQALLAEVLDKGIASQDDFLALLRKKCASASDVTFGNKGKISEYIKYRPRGSNKFIRLKQVFTRSFLDLPVEAKRAKVEEIFRKKYNEPRPEKLAPEEVNQKLDDWFAYGALEVRYLTMKNRDALDAYYALNSDQKREFLLQRRGEQLNRQLNRRRHHEQIIRKHEKSGPDCGGRGRHADASADQSSLAQPRPRVPPDFGPRLPPLPVRTVAKEHRERTERAVSGDAQADLAHRRNRGAIDGLRRDLFRKEERKRELTAADANGRAEDSVAGQLLRDVKHEQLRAREEVTPDLNRIKRELDPLRLLKTLSRPPYSITVEQYEVGSAKDGSPRIKCGSRSLTLSDFLTREMHLPWPHARDLMQDVFARQLLGEPGAAHHAQPDETTWRAFQKAKSALAEADRQKIKQIKVDAVDAAKALRDTYRAEIKAARKNKADPPAARKVAVAILQMQLTTALWQAEEEAQQKLAEMERRRMLRDFDRYRHYLHELASVDDTDALLQLQRHRATEVQPMNAYGYFVGTGDVAATATLPKKTDFDYEVDVDGAVTYFHKKSHKPVLRDEGQQVTVLDPETTSVETALRLAMEKFGLRLKATGTLEFKEKLCRLVVDRAFNVTFTDPSMMEMIMRMRKEREETEGAFGFSGVETGYVTTMTTQILRDRYGLYEQMQPDGSTVYQDKEGTPVLNDCKMKVAVLRQDPNDVHAALMMAQDKYGHELRIYGSADFREKVAQAVTDNGIDVCFDDDALNARIAHLRLERAKDALVWTSDTSATSAHVVPRHATQLSLPAAPRHDPQSAVPVPERKKKSPHPDPWAPPMPKPLKRKHENPDW